MMGVAVLIEEVVETGAEVVRLEVVVGHVG